MRHMVAHFALLTVAVLALPGCGGAEKAPPAETQQKRLQTAEESMKQGMEAMKGMKPGAPKQ